MFESEVVWKQFSNELKWYIYSKVKNNDDANDILQEVFIKVHLSIASLQKKESIKSWLFSITHNAIMIFFKKEKGRHFDSFDSEITNSDTEVHSPQNCILPLINLLPEKYKAALLQSEIYGKKQAEVATILNISLTATKSRIQRGRKLLQKGFIDCCDYKLSHEGVLVGEHGMKENCKVCN